MTVAKTAKPESKTARRIAVEAEVARRRKRRGWTPFKGPQLDAYKAARVVDVMGYGGAGGGGKSFYALGVAYLQHRRSIIYRRTIPQLSGMEEVAKEVYAGKGRYNEQRKVWRLKRTCDDAGHRITKPIDVFIQFGSMNRLEDREKWRGNPFDCRIFDEAQNFLREQVTFVMAWTRTSVEGQHCCDIFCFNPPTSPEGLWLIEYFAPWIDLEHGDPAKPGEVRWFITLPDGKEREVEGPRNWQSADFKRPDPIVIEGREFIPRSRTFFPARVTDNPVYMATGYMAVLDALPEPLRSQMRDGDFSAGLEDDIWQVCPAMWVKLAMARGKVTPRPVDKDGKPKPWASLGADVAAGGTDRTAFARHVEDWYGALVQYPGSQTPDGNAAAGLLVQALDGAKDAQINIDVIGIGQGLVTALNAQSIKFNPINVAGESYAYDRSGLMKCKNLKAEIYWKFREALDPASGRNICLPDDRALFAELCAARYSVTSEGITIEPKDKTIERLGRSPDLAESVMLANHVASRAASTKNPWSAGRK